MARVFLDDKTFIEDTIQLPVYPDKPAPPREHYEAYRKADAIVLADVLKQENWDLHHLDMAIGVHGFPKPYARQQPRLGFGSGQPVYSRDAIEQWRARFLEFADKVQRRK